jgi:hypothetical protein
MPVKSRSCVADLYLLKLEKKIEGFISEYINKVLFTINKNYQRGGFQKAEKNVEDRLNTQRKRETFVSHFSRKCVNSELNNIKLPEKQIERIKEKRKGKESKNSGSMEFIPSIQIDVYRLIELYAMSESRITALQKEFYQVISNTLLKMVYGMTL